MSNQIINKPINSTFKIPKPLIKTGQFLALISNGLATKFLARIFETPPKFKIPKREQMFIDSAKNEDVYIPALKHKIRVYTYGYSKKKVLLLHGWSGRGSQMYQIADKLLENKMMVVSLDAPAHGFSKGKKTNMLEYMKTIEFIIEKYGPFEIAIGHSWGAMTLLNVMAKNEFSSKIVVIGGEDKISDVLRGFITNFEMNLELTNNLTNHYFKKFGLHVDDFASSVAALNVMAPTLVIHDTQDKFVPVSSAYKIRQNLKNGILLITNGLGHHKILRNPKVINHIIQFIQK